MAKIKLMIMTTVMIAVLSACGLKTGDDLLQAPKPTKNYVALQKELEKIRSTGAVYAAPEAGQNRNYVQMIDIDSDGEDEVISFFRESSTSGKFMVYLHKRIGEKYIEMGKVTGHGISIESVSYPRFSSNGACGVVIGWRLGNDLSKGMTICTFENGTFKSVLETEYVNFSIADLDDDNISEILTCSPTTGGKYVAKLFDYEDNKISLKSETSLSYDMKSISKMRKGYIKHNIPAMFIEGKNDSGIGLFTDILVIEDGGLRNISLNSEQLPAKSTYRPVTVYATDINNDVITEIPRAVAMPGPNDKISSESIWMLEWYAFDTDSISSYVSTTFHNITENWYLMLPEKWVNKVSATKYTENGQSYTAFELYNKNGNEQLLRIYAFSGDNKEDLAAQSGFFKIKEHDGTVFAGYIPQSAYSNKMAITGEDVQKIFKVISQEWMS